MGKTYDFFQDRFKTICKSWAMKMYCMTEKELAVLQPDLRPNPYRVGMAPMILYTKKDVEDLAIQKWGNMSNIIDERHRRVLRLENRTESKITGVRKRKEGLKKCLDEKGLSFDESNPVCWSYIEGDELSLEKVVDMIEETDFLNKYTSYRRLLNEMLAEIENTGLPYNRLELEWRAKKIAISECFGMKNKKDENQKKGEEGKDEKIKEEEQEKETEKKEKEDTKASENDLQIVCVEQLGFSIENTPKSLVKIFEEDNPWEFSVSSIDDSEFI